MGFDIVRHSDFVIYDKDMKLVELPRDTFDYGTRGETITIENAGQSVKTERVGDRTHIREIQVEERSIELTVQIFGKTRHDYEIKERKLLRFFRELGAFYVSKGTAPNILYKVIHNGKIGIDKVNYIVPYALATVSLLKVDIDYGVSRFTTLDLHNRKVKFDGKWALGMNLEGIVSGKNTQYIFNQDEPIHFFNASDVPTKNISNPFFKVRIKVKSNVSKITLYDDYGNTFIYNNKQNESDNLKNGDVLEIRGVNIELNGKNVLSKTNKRFLKTKTGINKWRILEDFNYEIEFDFRYIYE